MPQPQDHDKLTRWREGGAFAVLVTVALWSLPLLIVWLPRWGLSWLVAPCVTSFLVFLALLILVRGERQSEALQKPISPDVVEAASKRFLTSHHEERIKPAAQTNPPAESIHR